MASYLWRKLSEKEKNEIKQEAEKLILEFGDAIEKLPDIPEGVVEREKDRREEDSEKGECEIDRDIMFKNAPEVKDDCILGERGKWIE